MLNVALIGYGHWGPNIARQLFANHNLNFTHICDKKEDRLAEAEKIYGKSVEYELDSENIINNNSIDAVFIATQTSCHFELAKEALLSAKHVYVEKPLTARVKDAIELKELSNKNHRILHTDHIMVFHPCTRKIKEIVDSGEIGDILYFDAQRSNLGQIKEDVSSMWDLAVHDLAMIDYITDGKRPITIDAFGAKYYNPKETLTFLSLRYDGFIAHIKSSWISPIKERRMIIAGTKKMIVYDDVNITEKVKVFDKGVDIVDNGTDIPFAKIRSGDVRVLDITESDALFNSIDHFRICVESNKQSLAGPKPAINIIRILEEADKNMNSV